MTITSEDEPARHLLEVFDADDVVQAPCPNCGQQANVATRGDGLAIETVGISCPWCGHLEFLDEEDVIDGG